MAICLVEAVDALDVLGVDLGVFESVLAALVLEASARADAGT